MKTVTVPFNFSVPEDAKLPDGTKHPEAGKKIRAYTDKAKKEVNPLAPTYSYTMQETEEEALAEVTRREWTILTIVNDKLESLSKANSYQKQMAIYKPLDRTAEEQDEAFIREGIRSGFPEAFVRELLAKRRELAGESQAGQ